MPKKPSTKVLKTCRIEKAYIEYANMQGINFNGLVNGLLKQFVITHQRISSFRAHWQERGIQIDSRTLEP